MSTTLGIIGPIASGKSTVAAMFERRGAKVVDADRLGHEVLGEPDVKAKAEERWGSGIFAADGETDREKLAEIVFAPTAHGTCEREFLEQLTHPGIRRRLDETLQKLENDGIGVVVVDAALLLEAGWDEFCDKIIYVEAPDRVGLKRASERGWSAEQYADRMAAQMPLDRKRARADIILNNSGTRESLETEVDRVLFSLRA